MRKTIIYVLLSTLLAAALTACSSGKDGGNSQSHSDGTPGTNIAGTTSEISETSEASELSVRFGDGGGSFTLYLENNETAAAIARHVGSADWRLPIYHFDDYDGWEVMQYYDIPSRYEIPSNAEMVTSEQAGQVYYSEPNRIVLFYQDADIAGEYTLVGRFEATEEFVAAVKENPVLEGWGNKIVNICA